MQERFFDVNCENCTPEERKAKSDHRELIEFFHDMTLKARGFKPRIGPKDAKQLKNILELGILDREEIEKLMLYFLADKGYRNLGPSLATMFSSTVLNSLVNKLKNRNEFYKELEGHASKHLAPVRDKRQRSLNTRREVDIGAKVEALRKKLSMTNNKNNERRNEERG